MNTAANRVGLTSNRAADRAPARLRLLVLATAALLASLAVVGTTAASAEPFGLTAFGTSTVQRDGSVDTQAGSHPYAASTSFQLATEEGPPPQHGVVAAGQGVKDIEVDLPAGFIGDPSAIPVKCTELELNPGPNTLPDCPPAAQVGTAVLDFSQTTSFRTPIYAMQPPDGSPAMFGFPVVAGVTVHLFPVVRTGGDYGLTIKIPDISQIVPLTGTSVTFWGVPADSSHDPQRGAICQGYIGNPDEFCFTGNETAGVPPTAFLSNPMDCAAGPLPTTMRATSWALPRLHASRTVSEDESGNPTAVDGCQDVPFEVGLAAKPTSTAADSPSGLDVKLTMPQPNNPDGVATAHLKRAEITFPQGMSVNPSSASGLGACSQGQIGLDNAAAPSCPESSRIGTVAIKTPLLDEPLEGSIYLAQQGTNPFNSLLAVYLAASGHGVEVKIAGKIAPDPVSGRLTASFDDNPQLPFETLDVQLKGGDRAPLLTPPTCGTYTTTASFSPWSAADPNNPTAAETVTSTSSFQVTSGPNGAACPSSNQFDPGFNAGTATPIAGAYSPLLVNAARPDGSAPLSALNLELPEGLTGKLAGIPYCSQASLDAAAGKSGAAEQASPSCPAASKVGTVNVGAGAGTTPFQVTGAAYLAGPYKGAPLSLAVITPAVAGPFDLGTVVVRSALLVDPTTTKVTVKSDQIPQILQGIPLKIRSIEVNTDRPEFTLNPTNCAPMSLGGTLFSPATAKTVSNRFQVGACNALGFGPKLTLSVKGGHKRGAYQRLTAVLTQPKGQANIGRVSVALPHSQFLAQEHIKTICTRVQFAANTCPAGSIYGHAKAFSPLLDQPLQGPVYLRSSNHPLPDLVAALRGQIDVDLVGRIDSVNEGIRNTFETVPDAPVSKFVLEMKGGKKSLLVNSSNICKSTSKATVKMDGQNGKVHDFNPVLGTSCGKKSRKKGKR